MPRALAKTRERLSFNEVLLISRPFWWIASAAPFVFGYFVSVDVGWSWPLAIGVTYFSICYSLLLYGLEDIFAYEKDARNPRRASATDPVLTKSKRWPLLIITLALNLPFVVYFVATGVQASTIWLIITLFMVVAYSVPGFRYKEIPGLDAITSAFHYVAPFIFAVLYAGGTNFWVPALLTFFIWAMANHTFGAIQNITVDQQAHVGSIATKLGAENSIVACLGMYTVAAILPTAYYGWKGLGVSVLLLWYAVLVLATVPFRKNSGNVVFRRAWHALTTLNYICGAVFVLYLLLLQHWA